MGRRRGVRDRRNLTDTVPEGHWRESEVLGGQGFPVRAPGEPYIVVVHKRAGAFVLDGLYRLSQDHIPGHDPLIARARKHHCSSTAGWVPRRDEQRPWWAKRLPEEDFTAYWVAE